MNVQYLIHRKNFDNEIVYLYMINHFIPIREQCLYDQALIELVLMDLFVEAGMNQCIITNQNQLQKRFIGDSTIIHC